MEAEITIEYDDVNMAMAIADAVSPDNYGTPAGLSIDTRAEKTSVVTKIKSCESFQTFVATIDDLLFSVATAEKTLLETVNLFEENRQAVQRFAEGARKNHCDQSF